MTLKIFSNLPDKISVALGCFLLLCACGCSIHPSTQDTTGLTSRQIARQIRCETRQAVIDSLLIFLTSSDNIKRKAVNEASRKVGLDLAAEMKENESAIKKFKLSNLSGNARRVVGLFWATGIAYNYNLELTETNNNGGSLNLKRILPLATSDISFGANLNLERQNTRIFTITDNFGDLVTKTGPRYCDFQYQVENENIIYPLSGKIGIKPVIGDFVRLALYDNLAGNGLNDFTSPEGPSQMAEQLQFTTTIDVSAGPKVTFEPVTAGLHVAEAGLTLQSIRKDLHRLTIGLYIPKDTNLQSIRDGYLRDLAPSPLGVLASADAPSPGEKGALAIVNQALLLKLFQIRPIINVNR